MSEAGEVRGKLVPAPVPEELSDVGFTLPAWAVEAAASAPRISPADAAPLIAIVREAFARPAEADPFPPPAQTGEGASS